MTMQKRLLAQKTTALLSAIAASSLLGLPALAGNPAGATNAGSNQAQAPSNVDQPQCVPSNQANQPSTTATPDASAPAAAQLPNQSDPRAGISPSDQTVSPSNQTTSPSNQTTSASGVQPVDTGDASRQTASYNRGGSYGDVLSQGGATAGGFASQQVSAANNPSAYQSSSSRISSNEKRPNYGNSSAGMDGNMSSTMRSNDSMRSTTGSQPYNQSSRATASTTIALCPNGTTPQSATPSTRQAPSQPTLDAQPSPSQQTSPQQPSGNETRQSPADDNGGRTR
ncbi:MAG: hypothetical protein KME27_12435 [Lyngbya sp. HA4199-MV5]|jgi:hypothetical protein|nr:hypothetical protein [Lyngbya sp. HA4199-MV5]